MERDGMQREPAYRVTLNYLLKALARQIEGKALVEPETLSVKPKDAQTEGNNQDKQDGETILSGS
jgi:hypothetical protein